MGPKHRAPGPFQVETGASPSLHIRVHQLGSTTELPRPEFLLAFHHIAELTAHWLHP